MKANPRLTFIDALKGIAIPGVLFAHMSFTGRFDAAALDHILLLQSLTAWCVLAFFFASGFLHGHADADRDWKSFAQRRAVRLLIPCAAFSWMNKLALLAAKSGGLLATGSAPPLATPADILAFVFIPAAPQFYFLAHLFLIAIAVHALLRARLLAHPLAPWSLAALLLQSYWFIPLTAPHGESLTRLPFYTALYLTGIAFARSHGAEKCGRVIHHAGMVIFAAAAIPLIAMPAHPSVLYALVPPALALLLPFVPALILSPLASLGRKSGAIYVWHAPLIMTFFSLLLAKRIASWPLVIAMTLLTIVASLVLDSIVRRVDKRGILRL